MQFVRELFSGALLFKLERFEDARGSFVKTFARSVYEAAGLDVDFHEEFYSLSRKNVIRGMHFQRPPHDHVKLVACPAGAVLDVLLDLRQGPGYGVVESVVLSADAPAVVVIPRGVAHGFKALADNSLMIYKTTTEYAPTHDAGIRWDSFGFDWGGEPPIVSARDAAHPALSDFQSPFGSP